MTNERSRQKPSNGKVPFSFSLRIRLLFFLLHPVSPPSPPPVPSILQQHGVLVLLLHPHARTSFSSYTHAAAPSRRFFDHSLLPQVLRPVLIHKGLLSLITIVTTTTIAASSILLPFGHAATAAKKKSSLRRRRTDCTGGLAAGTGRPFAYTSQHVQRTQEQRRRRRRGRVTVINYTVAIRKIVQRQYYAVPCGALLRWCIVLIMRDGERSE